VTDVIAYDQADKSGIFTKTIVSAHEKGQNDNPCGRRGKGIEIGYVETALITSGLFYAPPNLVVKRIRVGIDLSR
jgi:hypothetical protein